MPRYSPFERRRRRIARASLYSSFLLVASFALLFWHQVRRPIPAGRDMSWHETDWTARAPVRWLQQYVRIDTGPGGDELAGALFLASALRTAGLAPEIVSLGPQHANLRAVLPGKRPEQLVLLGHLDVEPTPHPELWNQPPFSGALVGPMLWGRGTFDMKSYTAAQLWALHHLAAAPSPPDRSVSLMVTSEEEAGSHLGMRWLLWQRPDWFGDVWAVLTEGGLVEARSLSDPKYWAVEVGQRSHHAFQVCAADRARLEAFRTDVRQLLPWVSPTPVRVVEPIRDFWAAYWPTRDREELRQALADPEALERDAVTRSRLPRYLRSLMQDEVAVGEIEPAPDGDGWTARVAVALLPGTELEQAIARLLPEWLTAGLELTRIEEEALGGVSPTDHPVYRATVERLRREDGVEHAGPFVLPWTLTDGRFLRPRDIPVYGFSPFLFLTPETWRANHRNERVPAPAFVRGVDLYRDVVVALAGTPGAEAVN